MFTIVCNPAKPVRKVSTVSTYLDMRGGVAARSAPYLIVLEGTFPREVAPQLAVVVSVAIETPCLVQWP